jgi:serine O-acetyltransferase
MDQILPRLTARLLTSYRHVGGINNIEVVNVPSKRAVGLICEDLLRLLFPGFHDEQPILSSELEAITSTRVEQLADRLNQEICKSLRTRIPGGCPVELANEIVTAFLGELHTVRELLRTDVEAAYEGDPAAQSYEEIIVSYPFIEAIAIHRLAHLLYRKDLPLVPRMMAEWAHSRTGIDIHPGAQIGSHFFIDHGTGVVIGETSVIGSHVKLYQGVSLVAKSFQKDEMGHVVKGGKRHPDVGDNVTIYANTIVLGADTTIGSGSTIGGNVFLMHSVPPDSLVIYEETQLKILAKRSGRSAASAPVAEDWSYAI